MRIDGMPKRKRQRSQRLAKSRSTPAGRDLLRRHTQPKRGKKRQQRRRRHYGGGHIAGNATFGGRRRTVSQPAPGTEMPDDGAITTASVLALLEANGCRNGTLRCALSGRLLTIESATLDHIVPLATGGENLIGNIQVLESRVNTAKGTLSQEEFIALCCDVARTVGGMK